MFTDNTFIAERPDRFTTRPRAGAILIAVLLSVARTATMWRRRTLGRACLRDLDPHLLDDVGISTEQRDQEVRKPFWVS